MAEAENDTIFGKILRGEIETELVYEDDDVVAFRDLRPVAPVHILVIPRKHIVNLLEAGQEDALVLGKLMLASAKIARAEGLEESGYRVVVNNGAGVGQSVFHLHVHILGGRSFSWPPG
ncbi:MAG: histidine triad nucleotide-binding protein [Bradymonadaceae bacterium]|nr:histidine triad nucleotide-binding protein [Lujinxingiaceae bacterium]